MQKTSLFIKNKKLHTAKEIEGQPKLWREVYDLILGQEKELNEFLLPIFKKKELKIILTGAGSSAFIGEAAQGIIQENTFRITQAIATTDIVTHPNLSFQPDLPTLLISFARSGNSPESLETVKLANLYCSEIYHLIITCNESGELLNFSKDNKSRSYSILLPKKSNDKSLAMTGSFTSMLLSVLLISDIKNMRERENEIEYIIFQGTFLLKKARAFEKLAKRDFDRVVFLGSGPMLGIARECHLKLQELTDGKVICKHDSFLGFRHGPRAVTNEKTLLVYLFSPINHVYQYELDLALSIAEDERNIPCISIGRPENNSLKSCLNLDLKFKPEHEFFIVPACLVGQLLGFYKSLKLNLNPDNPSVSGTISRVVQGVKIYEYPN